MAHWGTPEVFEVLLGSPSVNAEAASALLCTCTAAQRAGKGATSVASLQALKAVSFDGDFGAIVPKLIALQPTTGYDDEPPRWPLRPAVEDVKRTEAVKLPEGARALDSLSALLRRAPNVVSLSLSGVRGIGAFIRDELGPLASKLEVLDLSDTDFARKSDLHGALESLPALRALLFSGDGGCVAHPNTYFSGMDEHLALEYVRFQPDTNAVADLKHLLAKCPALRMVDFSELHSFNDNDYAGVRRAVKQNVCGAGRLTHVFCTWEQLVEHGGEDSVNILDDGVDQSLQQPQFEEFDVI